MAVAGLVAEADPPSRFDEAGGRLPPGVRD
jgi:hypothetical protein